MNLSKHAQQRQRQRGFSDLALEIIQQNGRYEKAAGGAIKIFLGNREYQQIVQDLKGAIQLLDRVKGSTMVIKGGNVLTVFK